MTPSSLYTSLAGLLFAHKSFLVVLLAHLLTPSVSGAQEVAFESSAQLPVLVSPAPQPDDEQLRLAMHANVERRSRIFYLGLAASALYSPDDLSHISEAFELRPQVGFRMRSATQAATDFIAERIAIVGPLAFAELGFRASWKLNNVSGIYARTALRGGFDVTRVDAENLGDAEDEEVVSATLLYGHAGFGGHVGPFQLGVEVEYFNVPSQSDVGDYKAVLDGTLTVPFFAMFRLSRQVYFYFRAIPFHDFSRLPYTWGIAAVLNP